MPGLRHGKIAAPRLAGKATHPGHRCIRSYGSQPLLVLLDHQQVEVILQAPVALLITIEVLSTVAGSIETGEMCKVEPRRTEPLMAYATSAVGIQRPEDAPVLAQLVVHTPDVVGIVAVQPVVVHAAALIGTKFFVNPAFDGCATFGAGLF